MTGWIFDQLFGDGDYTPKEMLTDAVVGLLGGGLWKPVTTSIRRGWTVGRHYLDDAVRVSSNLMDDALAWVWVFSPFARPGAATAVGYAAADYIHDTYFSQSPGNSSQVLPAGSASPGGTTVSPILPTRTINRMMKMSNSADRSRWRREGGACPSGYELKKVKGKWMCVRKTSKKSRSR